MIHLLTAVPGSGKTLWMIGEILRLQADGRRVYSNIVGLLVPNVYPSPDDWRDTPEGSVVIYDEAQEIFPSNARPGPVSDDRLTAMERHRHTGHDLYFITQAPSFVHHHIRKLVGRHVHLYRPNGLQGANIYTWNFTCDSPNDREEQKRADHVIWKFPKEHFALYKSATIHTHKRRIPVKIAVVLVLISIGACVVAWQLRNGFFSHGPSSEASFVAAAEPGASVAPRPAADSPYSWSSTPAAVPIAGCISSDTRCMCFSEEGVTLALERAQCLSVINSPFPRSIKASPRNET